MSSGRYLQSHYVVLGVSKGLTLSRRVEHYYVVEGLITLMTTNEVCSTEFLENIKKYILVIGGS